MKKINLTLLAIAISTGSLLAEEVYNLADYGLQPNITENQSSKLQSAMSEIMQKRGDSTEPCKVLLPTGKYYFGPEGAISKELYISNHDQDNPKLVGLMIEGARNVTFDGQGSDLIFDGRMLPVVMSGTTGCKMQNFSIDFSNPHIGQAIILENDTVAGTMTYELAPWMEYELRDSVLYTKGKGWEHAPCVGIAFEGDTKRLVYQTSDIGIGNSRVVELAPRKLKSLSWNDKRLVPGTAVALRTYGRPTPGIFMHRCNSTVFNNVKVHYAEGMGLLAQLCNTITLDGFGVCLRGDNDSRYFTTQADATHFSSCKGMIYSVNGLYEGMMDDAINVHGTYLKVTKVINEKCVQARYMHPQAYGFDWGFPGDSVSFVRSKSMDVFDGNWTVESIKPVDKETVSGAKEFMITFDRAIPAAINENETFGIENLSWTPEVVFANNTIRNNRARGALFSTPRKVIVENNLFDHTSGTAILLCGDCNGWFETGACRDVTIRGNYFLNALTNMFQFTSGVISIYPEIPNLKAQQTYFHSGIVIESNIFDTFDKPLIYAKSVDSLTVRDNIVRYNKDYKAFHWNNQSVLLERVNNAKISF